MLGFSYCTLERIGGTPSLLWGLASVKRNAKRDTVLRGLISDQFRRAVLAFPDEDVLVGTRARAPGFGAYAQLEDIVPRPGYKATGEERAWSRRLAKRFGCRGSGQRPDLHRRGHGRDPGRPRHRAAQARDDP